MSQFFTLLTKTGQGLLANAIAYGEPLTIAELAIGDGGGQLPTPDASVTRLVNEVRRGPINQTTTDPDNPNWTVVEQVLPADVGGWTIREVGLYDTDGNLIAYGNYPETYKPQLSEGSSRTQTIRFVMEVTDTSAVTLRIDPSVVMASRKYVDDQITAHARSRNHPAGDTKNSGMMRFATLAESKKGEESKAAQTPAGGMAQLDEHRKEKEAHNAGQIALEKLLDTFGDAETVQQTLAMLGDAALKKASSFATSSHTHDSVKNARNDYVGISATGNLDHYVGGEYIFRVNSDGKLDRAKGGIAAALLVDKAKVGVIPHMFGADGDGYVGLSTTSEIATGANLRLTTIGNFIYQFENKDIFRVDKNGSITTNGDVSGSGSLRMTGDNWKLGSMSGEGASMYMDGTRWAYASDYRIAFNNGQQRAATTIYGLGEIRSDGNVTAALTIDGINVLTDKYNDYSFKRSRTFTSSGSFDVPAELKNGNHRAYVIVRAGGGGGGANSDSGAGGGAQGGVAEGLVNLTDQSRVAVTVGDGGSGARGNGTGDRGGSSSFGTYMSATGGAGGSVSSGGAGGSATGGAFSSQGRPGGVGFGTNSSRYSGFGGGPGGRGIQQNSDQSSSGENAGGAGGGGAGGVGTGNGGNGYRGEVIIFW